MKDPGLPKNSLKKSKLDDYFKKVERNTEENLQEQSTSADVQKSLRCPKRKVLDDDATDDNIIAKKEKRAVRKRSSGHSMKKLAKSQMVLDCGQSVIGSTKCKDCRMMYSVDSAEDVAEHEKFHNAWRFRFEISRTFVPNFLNFHNRDHGNFKVYYLATFADGPFKKLFNEHMKKINEELGYCDEKNDLWSPEKRIFLVLSVREERMLIGGILVIEKISRAWTNVGKMEVTDNNDINDWIVGVDRIWVDSHCRMKGVANSLLDAATTQDRQMEFRSRRLRIAFCDPTDDGIKLARRFIETRYQKEDQYNGEILIY